MIRFQFQKLGMFILICFLATAAQRGALGSLITIGVLLVFLWHLAEFAPALLWQKMDAKERVTNWIGWLLLNAFVIGIGLFVYDVFHTYCGSK